MNKHLKLTMNSSGITIQLFASVSFPFSKMSKPNVEPTQPELFPQKYSSQYIKPSTHLHLLTAVKMQLHLYSPLHPYGMQRGHFTLYCIPV
jgi:hypothetical protein